MENKINIAELLRNCPKGMELYSTIYGTVYFEGVRDTGYATMIDVTSFDNTKVHFYPDGKFNTYYSDSEMTLFPSKDVRTWEGFQRPFVDGDVVIAESKEDHQIFLLKYLIHNEDNQDHDGYCYFGWDFQYNELFGEGKWGFDRLATEDEKTKLFQAIKDNGYKWNAETKTLEKLVVPKFKVGDRIKSVISSNYYTVIDIRNDQYFIKSDGEKFPYHIPFSIEANYELVPNKFDINTLVPFESKVLVRNKEEDIWRPAIFGCYVREKKYPYYVLGSSCWKQCIPYDCHRYLSGKTDDCDEYFKTWE